MMSLTFVNIFEQFYAMFHKPSTTPIYSVVTDGGQGGESPPWKAKYKNWTPFNWNFDI